MKKILIIGIVLISILSLSSVSAQENSTDAIGIVQTENVSDVILSGDVDDEILSEDVSDVILSGDVDDEFLSEDVGDEILKEYSVPAVEVGPVFVEGVESIANYINVLAPFSEDLNEIEIYIDDVYLTNYEIVDFMGTPFSPWAYAPGEHVITAKYYGKYGPFEVNTTFRVVEVEISIPNEVDFNNPGYISVTTIQYGNITVYVNGSLYKTLNNSQGGSIYLDNLDFGANEIKVVFSRDSDNFETIETKIVNVTYEFRCYNVKMDDYEFNATISLPNDINNTPVATIEGKNYPLEKLNSSYHDFEFKVSVDLSELSFGKHYINITYLGDDKYPQKTIIREINIVEQNSTPVNPITPINPSDIDINKKNLTPTIIFNEKVVKDVDYGGIDYLYIIINGVPETEHENIMIYIDNSFLAKYGVLDGIGFPFSAWDYDLGEHVITAKYEGTLEYNPFLINTTFEVVALEISIPDEIIANDYRSVKILASGSVTGNVTVYVNGSKYKSFDLINHYPQCTDERVNFDGLDFGTYEIKVVYSGDKYHPELIQTKIVNVTYLFDLYDWSDNYNYNASIRLPNDVNNTPIATIGGKTYPFEKIDGNASFSEFKVSVDLSELSSGNYYINITYPGDDKYPQKIILKEIEVLKQNSTPVDVDVVKQNLTPTINFDKEVVKDLIYDGIEYNIYIVINGVPETEFENIKIYMDTMYISNYYVLDGIGVPISAWCYAVGEHVITAEYGGTFEYNPFLINTTFEVVPYKISIPDEIIVNSLNTVLVLAPYSVSGNVTVYVNGSQYEKFNLNKKYPQYTNERVNFDGLDFGTYEIKVVYSGDNYHSEFIQTKIVNVTYLFNLYDWSDSYSYNATINLPNDVDNTPIATIEGKTYPFEKIGGNASGSQFKVSVDLSELSSGNYYINITYPGDDKYPQKTILKEVNIIKPNSGLETENVTVEYGMPIRINFTLENATKIKYQLIDSNKNLIKEDISNEINLNDLKLDVGTYTLNMTTVTGGKYNEKTATSTLTIIKAPTNVTANMDDIQYSEIATINIEGNVNATVIVKIDGKNTKTIEIIKNTITPVTFENIPTGKHDVSVVLKPTNNNYNESTCNMGFTVFKKQSTIDIVCDKKIVEGSSLTVNVNVLNATGKIKVNGKETTLTNGKAGIEVTNLVLGDNTIEVTYDGDERYTNASASVKVNVYPKSDSNLKATVSDVNVGETAVIYIEIDGKVTGDVTVGGNKVTVKDGKANYSISDLPAGEYVYIVKFAGDKYFKEANQTVAFKVNNVSVDDNVIPKIVSKNITYVLYAAKGKYSVTVYGKDGKVASGVEVIFEINGKQTKKETDENGVAKYTITKTPGTYKVTTKALGVIITKTLKVKHLVTLKKATPKKSAKKLVLQATLAKVNGKYLKNKQVTFKFNGKTYKAKTNYKGVAKVTIKSSVLKKLKAGKKITYRATYLKDTVKQTVKIKK